MLRYMGTKNVGTHFIESYSDLNTFRKYNHEEYFDGILLGIFLRETYFRTYEKKLILHYYLSRPTSSEYQQYCNKYTKFLIPLVYTKDDDGNFKECLNTEIQQYIISRNDGSEKWIDIEVKLTRDIDHFESLFVGFYANVFTPNSSSYSGTKSYIYQYIGAWPVITLDTFDINNFKTNFKNLFTGYANADREFSFYYEFYDQPLPVDYKLKLKDEISFCDSKYKTKIGFCRNLNSKEKLTDKLKRLTNLKRVEKSKIEQFSSIYKCIEMNRLTDDEIKSFDNTKRIVGFFRKLKTNIFVKAIMRICRELKIAIKTVLSFWDFVKKSIFKEDSEITFFSPITIELEIESKI